mgnify:CR=1 FL=1
MWRFTKRVLSNRRVRVWLGVVGLFALVVIGAAGWHVKDATDPARVEPIVLPGDLVFADGDIILAGGVSLQSRAVTALVGGERYSHVGLIELTEDGPMVLHASPRGAGDGGVGDRVARLPLAVFLCERGDGAVRLLRLRPSEADAEATFAIPAEAARIAGGYADAAVPFDHRYDLAEHEALYCTELVWLAYAQAGLDWPDAIYSHPSLTRADGPVILPGSFVDDARFTTVWDTAPDSD